MIYLDYQATTPPASEVVHAMEPWNGERFANPHSPSKWGREAEAAIEHALAEALGLEGGRVAFTGNATEAINWALKGTMEKAPTARNRIVTVATEHAAVLDTCQWLAGRGYEVTVLPVGPDGSAHVEPADELNVLPRGRQMPFGAAVLVVFRPLGIGELLLRAPGARGGWFGVRVPDAAHGQRQDRGGRERP